MMTYNMTYIGEQQLDVGAVVEKTSKDEMEMEQV